MKLPIEKIMLENFMFPAVERNGIVSRNLNPNIVGQTAFNIAKCAGFDIPEDTSIILAECDFVGEKELLSKEKLSPVLAAFKVKDAKEQ